MKREVWSLVVDFYSLLNIHETEQRFKREGGA